MKSIERVKSIEIVQDMENALVVLRGVGRWMLDSGMQPSKYWYPENMSSNIFHSWKVEESDFYVAMVDGQPGAVEILEWEQKGCDWGCIDKGLAPNALYINWLCVDRKFAGQGFPGLLVDFAARLASSRKVNFLRLDIDATEPKLMELYQSLDFQLMGIEEDEKEKIAFFQKRC